VVVEPFLDRTKMVNSSIQTVGVNLAEGALIVILVLVFFLGNLRAGLLVASIIPLSMLFAVCMMNFFGVSGNLMSLGALDFGLIVDGAVIVVEAVLHRLHVRYTGLVKEGRSVLPGQAELKEEVRGSSGKMMGAAFFGQLIILMVYLPILSLQGIEGKMFIPMAQTVLFALLGAFILSLTYVPMMSSWVLRWNAREWEPSRRIMHRLQGWQQQILVKSLDRPRPVLVGILLLALGSFALFTTLGGEFIPDLPEGDFAVETKLLPGSNLKTTTDAVLQASALIRERYPEVIKVVGKIGSGEIPTDPMPMEAADLMIILKDPSEWTSASSWEELSARMAQTLEEIPGVAFGFQYPVAMRFNELMTGAKQDVVIKIYGENLDSLSRLGKKIGSLVQKVPGAVEVWVEAVEGLPQAVVRFDRPALARYGLDITDVNHQIQTAYAGRKVGEIIEDEKRFDLILRMPEELRQNAEAVRDLPIACRDGSRIPLREIATVAVEPGVNQIQRDDARRRLMVGFNVRDRDVQSVVQDVQALCRTQFSLPSGYTLHFGGAFENLQKASARLALVVPLALALIGLLLYLAMGSLRLAGLVFVTVPLSAVGGILLLWARGLPFSISAGIGFIVLFGVAVLNGIVLIKEYLSLEDDPALDARGVVLRGTANRLRPVLMTASVASLGFLPMALSQGAGAEVQRPLATVVIGGLLLATLMTLVVLPVLYTLWRHRSLPTPQPPIPNN
jgi:cobalt-zinc-cadmium resistance protein CzcA